MRRIKLMFITAVSAALLSLAPLQSAQAANPAKTCNQAVLNFFSVTLKEMDKAFKNGCKGKSPTGIELQGLAKINKAIDKINAVNDKLDCQANADPDLAGSFPLGNFEPGEEILMGSLADWAGQGATFCDGVETMPQQP